MTTVYTSEELHDLIVASKNGDEQALSRLIASYAESVHGLIFSIIGDRHVVEDLAQETFLRAITALHQYEFRAPFRSWLYRIAVNLCRDHFRRKKVRRIVSHYEKEDNQADENILIDHGENPDQYLEREEKRRHIEAALDQLPPTLRTVFVLRDIQELSYEEIAGMMSWRLGTVKSRLFRARKELAQILSPIVEDL